MDHPGTITFVAGPLVTVKGAWVVPPTLRFASTDAGPIPIVRVETLRFADRRIVRQYGPSGQLLRSRVAQ